MAARVFACRDVFHKRNLVGLRGGGEGVRSASLKRQRARSARSTRAAHWLQTVREMISVTPFALVTVGIGTLAILLTVLLLTARQ
jgi:hypothetical protein